MKAMILLLLLAMNAGAADLGFYRESHGIVNDRGRYERLAQQRARGLREKLGTSHLRLAVPSLPVSGKHQGSSSLYLKQAMSKGAAALRKDSDYERPSTFDPSNFDYENDAAARNRRTAVCRLTLGMDLARIVNEFAVQIHRSEENRKAEAANEAKNARAAGPAIEKYIEANQPREAGRAALSAKLGRIHQIEAVDGRVTRLRFTLGGGDGLTVSVNSLATFRSGNDEYFLAVQECLIEYVRGEIESAKKRKAELEDTWVEKRREAGKKKLEEYAARITELEAVQAALAKKLQGAKHVNEFYSKLSRDQLNFLIDLFVQLRGADLLVEEEIQPLSEYMSRAGQESMNNDYLFYKAIHEELYQLETYLAGEAEAEAEHKALLEKIRGGRK